MVKAAGFSNQVIEFYNKSEKYKKSEKQS